MDAQQHQHLLRTCTVSYLPTDRGTVVASFSDSSPRSALYSSHEQRLDILAELETALAQEGFEPAVQYYHPAGQSVQHVQLYVARHQQ